ncbi:NAD(P)-dependent dehydrogenase (short-subunit alcohol dehydrogenase family) [Ochrobactrum daejeonense]|uniref:NAD(P)-dependent dehydrogenase (Short-subunit alcohol dehydrogenase family) n=1 Tax=Brucella daejeonensis TaxID=659015 RepID=A0A7W9B293_9HYPH|nr:SDR family oxidoreductase [Brucella daejeonensis]MBB5704494.1 NAD(P)-dependent dehydrogenase (short-subunit alcohol dehydrogenase family) [Brucella daejeonensis]
MSKGRVYEKVAIVTGGARGIGKATAIRLAEEGASIAIFDILDEGQDVINQIKETGSKAVFIKVDLTNEAAVKQAVETVVETFGTIDVLVNNAGTPGVNKLIHEMSEAEWDFVFNINVKGTFFMTKYVLPTMMAQKCGSIINFSSIYGLIGSADLPAYHATKGAVLMMSKTDAICYAPFGVRVNAVHPGSTKTELFMQAAKTWPRGKDDYLSMMGEKHPLTLGEPVDVANCVLFLASDEARFVTGTSLVCDGGYTAQ